MRVFLALELNEEAKNELMRIADLIKKEGLFEGNFVEKENLHLTLRFFGEKTDKEIEEIKEKLNLLKFDKFEVNLGEVGYFSPKFIRVLWVSLVSEKLNDLAREIEGLFGKERFSSHVTIARIKLVKDKKKFIDMLKSIDVKQRRFTVDKIVLKKSILTRQGPVYEDIINIPLQKA